MTAPNNINAIPANLREQLLGDPWMHASCLSGRQPVQWHHAIIWRGKKLQERFCIVPLTIEEHEIAREKKYARMIDEVVLKRATEQDLERYPILFRNLLRRLDRKKNEKNTNNF